MPRHASCGLFLLFLYRTPMDLVPYRYRRRQKRRYVSRKLQVPGAAPPPVPANHSSPLCFGGSDRLVWDVLWPRADSRLPLSSRVALISSATPEAPVPGPSGHVSGRPGHQEPGDPGRPPRRRPRRCAHAPGLLHHPGGDRVQHHPRR